MFWAPNNEMVFKLLSQSNKNEAKHSEANQSKTKQSKAKQSKAKRSKAMRSKAKQPANGDLFISTVGGGKLRAQR